MKFEEDFETLVINPEIDDIKKLKVNFKENFDRLLYLGQIRSYSDDNDYHTYILFEKNNKIFCFHEFENPHHLSFFSNCEESSIEKYFEILNSLDEINEKRFFSKAKIHYDYFKLKSETKKVDFKNKKNKI